MGCADADNQQETVIYMLQEYNDLVKVSNLPKKRKELAYYIVGFADAEGCFNVALKKQKDTRFGWVLDPVFHVTQHKSHRHILELCKRFLGCGRVIPKPGQPDVLQFYVDNRRQLHEKIIPFFERYKLLVKARDFEIFSKIVRDLEQKKHSNIDSFKEMVKIAFEMNQNGKQRRYILSEVMKDLSLTGSSETIRQTTGESQR
ncbi:hypothetical protein COU37_05535 [Candidatus Micrarchaeota archaeon CG10_big_fil_rev_8_21_14_0_10_45_29]|nr:MAG: hypothetical protein COU37_05535 [Candidatus Micrarchaeota archaeon CG10_big_fil_rev_8_21_14_0_10_45_29]